MIVSLLVLAQLAKFRQPYPRGWDVFYHLKVVKLMSGDGLAPFDPQSAGGRIQSYPPGYHVLLLSLWRLTSLRLELVGRLLSPLFFTLSLFALFRMLGGRAAAVLGVLVFGTVPEVFGAFSGAAMPQTLGLFAVIMALYHRRLSFPMALVMGFSHWLSAGVFFILFWLQSLWPRLRETAVWAAGSLAAFTPAWPLSLLALWDMRKRKKELAVTAALLFPIVFWKAATGVSYAAPSWGEAPSFFSYPYKLGSVLPVLFFLFPSFGVSFLQTGVFFLLSQLFPFIPIRFVLYLSLSAVAVAVRGLEIRGFSEKSILIATALLSFALLSSQLESAYWVASDLKSQDFDALKWTDVNTVSTLLAYKDSSAFWSYYYTDNPTVLDGFSEGVPDVYERMSDEFEFYASPEIDEEILEKWGIRYQFLNEMEIETFEKIFDLEKFEKVPSPYENNRTRILHYPPS